MLYMILAALVFDLIVVMVWEAQTKASNEKYKRDEAECRRRTKESWERYKETGDVRQIEEWGMWPHG